MSDQSDLMASVLDGFEPIGEDHPVAVETFEAVKAALEARARGEAEFMPGELMTADVTAGTVIRPGDTVVFSTRDRVTREAVAAIKQQLVEALPGITPIVLDGIHIEGIYRPEGDSDG